MSEKYKVNAVNDFDDPGLRLVQGVDSRDIEKIPLTERPVRIYPRRHWDKSPAARQKRINEALSIEPDNLSDHVTAAKKEAFLGQVRKGLHTTVPPFLASHKDDQLFGIVDDANNLERKAIKAGLPSDTEGDATAGLVSDNEGDATVLQFPDLTQAGHDKQATASQVPAENMHLVNSLVEHPRTGDAS